SRARGSLAGERPQFLGRRRPAPQGRRAQRDPDRRAADPLSDASADLSPTRRRETPAAYRAVASAGETGSADAHAPAHDRLRGDRVPRLAIPAVAPNRAGPADA